MKKIEYVILFVALAILIVDVLRFRSFLLENNFTGNMYEYYINIAKVIVCTLIVKKKIDLLKI